MPRRAWKLATVAALASSGVLAAQADDVLTPVQRKVLAEARTEAVIASRRAEAELLQDLSSRALRLRLRLMGAGELAKFSGQELLDMLKANLESVEYTSNFGLDAVSRKLHPGNEAMDLDTVEKYGHIPSEWELKVAKSRLVQNMSHLEWGVLDAAETGVYGLPPFSKPGSPSKEETVNRPKYLAGNLRRMDTGLEQYGAYAAVLRNGAVRDRALLAGVDSGFWESFCNSSVTPVVRPNWLERISIPCSPVSLAPVGVADHQVHTILANIRTYENVGGSLPYFLYQFLSPGAKVRPLESRFYTEAALLGGIRMQDLKLLVGSFPGLFGTKEGAALRDFCKRHGVPLAWGFSSGRTWASEGDNQMRLFPFEPFEYWPAGKARFMDPVAGWSATNATSPDMEHEWERVWAEVADARQRIPGAYGPKKAAFEAWWEELHRASAPVAPLRGGDCASADLCFGTRELPGGKKDCVCRAKGVQHTGGPTAPEQAQHASGQTASLIV